MSSNYMYRRVYERKEKFKNLFKSSVDEYFGITKYNSSVRTEVLAGLTTFMTMAYIIIVNPLILSTAGMDYKAVFVATCLAAATATLFMGLIAKKPFGMATGLGLNSVVAFGLILTLNIPWQIAMGLIFIEGFLVFILVLTNLREMVMHAIPHSLKMSIGVGIGMFISFIGFKLAHIVTASPENLIKFGDVSNPVFMIAALGVIIIMVMMAMKIKGSILYGIILTTIIAIGACFAADYFHIAFNLFGNPNLPSSIAPLTSGMSNLPQTFDGTLLELPNAQSLSTIGHLDLLGALSLSFVPIVFALMMVDFFDSLGTVMAVGTQAGLVDKEGKLLDIKKVLAVDAMGAMIGGFMGSSSNTAYVESSAGVSEGGRTGLTSVVIACLFLVGMLFVPLAYYIPAAATAPALIIVGFFMITMIQKIEWDNFEEALPAFLTITSMTFTFSISKGIGFGFISYCIIKLALGKWREVHPLMWVVSVIFLIYFIFVSNMI